MVLGQVEAPSEKRVLLPSKAVARRLCKFMAFVAMLLGIAQMIWPSSAAPTGKSGVFTRPLFEAFGSVGVGAFWIAVGVFLFLSVARDKKEQR